MWSLRYSELRLQGPPFRFHHRILADERAGYATYQARQLTAALQTLTQSPRCDAAPPLADAIAARLRDG
jgi:hypothetical protein